MNTDQELEGTALRIYVAMVNADKPLGPREITRMANLSSPSVAYRNLQKLDELGLVEKDAFGEYTVKHRQSVKGHVWIGGRLFPRLMFYSFFFLGVLLMEAAIAVARLLVEEPLQYDFILLISVTTIGLVLFLIEGALSTKNRK